MPSLASLWSEKASPQAPRIPDVPKLSHHHVMSFFPYNSLAKHTANDSSVLLHWSVVHPDGGPRNTVTVCASSPLPKRHQGAAALSVFQLPTKVHPPGTFQSDGDAGATEAARCPVSFQALGQKSL